VQGLNPLGINGEDLLVEGNGRKVEILLNIEISDLEILLDRLIRLAFLEIEVTHLQIEALLFGIGLDEFVVFFSRFVVLALEKVLLGDFEYLNSVDDM